MDNFLAFLFNIDSNHLLEKIAHRRFRLYEKLLLFLLSFSVIVMVLEENLFFEETFSVTRISDDPYSLKTNFKTTEPKPSQTLRILNLFIMFVLMFLIYSRKKAHFTFLKVIRQIEFSKPFFPSRHCFWGLFESGLMLIQTFPNMQGWYSVRQRRWQIIYFDDTILTFLGFIIRVILIIRSCLFLTKFSNPKSVKICFDNGVEAGLLFSLKSEFYIHLKLFALIFLLLIIFMNGILLRLSERSAQLFSNTDWDYLWNSFWCVIVTMTTVGYGDFVPRTDNGRVVVGFTAILGSMVTSMICFIFLIEFSFNRSQENAYERIKACECNQKLNESASDCISLAIRYKLGMKKATPEEKNQLTDEFFVNIKKKVREFRRWKKTIIDFKHHKRIERRLDTIKKDINEHFDELGALMNYYEFLKSKLVVLEKNQMGLDEASIQLEGCYSSMISSLDCFKEQNPIISLYTPSKIEKLPPLAPHISGSHLRIKIPPVTVIGSQSDFSSFAKVNRVRSPLIKTNSEIKMRNLTRNIEKQSSIKKLSRKSVTKPFGEEISPLKPKRLSIVSKKRVSILSCKEDKERTSKSPLLGKEGREKMEKSLSHSSSGRHYPSYDAFSNLEININNYLHESDSNPGEQRIEEAQEHEEKGEGEAEETTKDKEISHFCY